MAFRYNDVNVTVEYCMGFLRKHPRNKVTKRERFPETTDMPAYQVFKFDPSTTKGYITFLKVFRDGFEEERRSLARLQTDRDLFLFKTETDLEQHLKTIFIWKHGEWAENERQKQIEDAEREEKIFQDTRSEQIASARRAQELREKTMKAANLAKIKTIASNDDVDRLFGSIIMRLRNEKLLRGMDAETVWEAIKPRFIEKLAQEIKAQNREDEYGDNLYAWAALDKLASILNSA
jgi:hypothetical protein